MDFARARAAMVESQVRTADVTNPAILAAMRALPRELFVAASARALAYADIEPEAAPGRVLLRPRDLAKLLHEAAPRPGDRALELAGATGYGAAVLGACVAQVFTQDPSPELSFAARAALDKSGAANVTAVCTEASTGWPDGAPYDLIVLNGATEFIPEPWFAQLAEGGRLAVIVRAGPIGQARIYLRSGGAPGFRTAFDAAPALAPGLVKVREFAF